MTLEEKVQAVMGKLLMDTCMQATNIEQLQEQVKKLIANAKPIEGYSKPEETEGNS